MPRLRLDPTSPSGVSIAPEPVQVRPAPGYVSNKATGLITAGTNVTITGSGTSDSPYRISSSGGGGGTGGASVLDDLTDVDVSTTPPNWGDVLAYDADLAEWKNGPVLWGSITGSVIEQSDLASYIANAIDVISVGALFDVYAPSPGDGQVLTWDATNGYYTPADIPATGGGSYTDEQAQDATGAMIADTSTLNLTYTDATPELKGDVLDSPQLQGHDSAYHLSRANHTGTQTASTISDFSTAADARITAAVGSTIASLSGGKVPTSQLPAVGLVTVQTAASQAAQLALTTQEGDVVVRSDQHKTYMRNAGTAGDMTDFTLLDTPTDAVTSVNGQTGTVVLAKSDVGLGGVDNTSDATKNSAVANLTNKDLTSGTNTFPTFNQSTTGSAAKWTTARNLAGNSVDGSANVAFANKFIVQGTADAGLSSAQFLGALSTGLLKNTTTTGVLSVATAGTDYVAPGGALGTPSSGTATNLTGTASGLTAGNVTTNANLTGVITSVGNATSIASQTGTGSKFVVDTSPIIVTPTIASFTNATHNHQNAAGGGTLTNAALTNSSVTIGSTSVALGATAATVAGLTLTTPVISSISNTGTITLPTSTDTLVGKATTDILTNKTIASTTNSVSYATFTNPYKFSAVSTAAQNTGNAAFATTAFATEEYDTGNNYASNTFTAPVAGYYHFDAHVNLVGSASIFIVSLFKNGTEYRRGFDVRYAAQPAGGSVSTTMLLAANDLITIRTFGNAAIAIDTVAANVWFNGYYMGPN
jgi:hypothetical protein